VEGKVEHTCAMVEAMHYYHVEHRKTHERLLHMAEHTLPVQRIHDGNTSHAVPYAVPEDALNMTFIPGVFIGTIAHCSLGCIIRGNLNSMQIFGETCC
jgi:hypothetical protein